MFGYVHPSVIKDGRLENPRTIQMHVLMGKIIELHGFVWKCWVNIPNEIAIFNRDTDQQNLLLFKALGKNKKLWTYINYAPYTYIYIWVNPMFVVNWIIYHHIFHSLTRKKKQMGSWDHGYMGCPKHASDVSIFLTLALAIPWSAALWSRLAGRSRFKLPALPPLQNKYSLLVRFRSSDRDLVSFLVDVSETDQNPWLV